MKTKIKISFLLVILTLLFTTILTSCTAGSEVVYSKEELTENVNAETNESLDYVWEYLDAWKFPAFNQSKMKRIEKIFRDNYYEEIPSSYEIAKEVATQFLENSYDTIDLTSSQKVSDALLTSFVKTVGDSYCYYRTNEQYDSYTGSMSGNFVGIGVNVSTSFTEDGILVISPVKYSPAEKAGVLANDIITKIDGQSVLDMTLDEATDMIKGESGTEVVITIKRGEEVFDLPIVRGSVREPTVDYTIDENKIGYIDINSFKANTDEMFIEAVNYMKYNEARVIIYDVRDNGGGYLDTVLNMLDYIAVDGLTLVSFSESYGEDPEKSDDGHALSIPAVILCNNKSASASELFTQGMRDLSSLGHFPLTVVGRTTYGKFVMQNTYTMTDGSAITLTVSYYFSPLGHQFNGIGIIPDVDLTKDLSDAEIKKLTSADYLNAAFTEAEKLLENK